MSRQSLPKLKNEEVQHIAQSQMILQYVRSARELFPSWKGVWPQKRASKERPVSTRSSPDQSHSCEQRPATLQPGKLVARCLSVSLENIAPISAHCLSQHSLHFIHYFLADILPFGAFHGAMLKPVKSCNIKPMSCPYATMHFTIF